MAVYILQGTKDSTLQRVYPTCNSGKSEILYVGTSLVYENLSVTNTSDTGNINRAVVMFGDSTLTEMAGLISSGSFTTASSLTADLKLYHAYQDQFTEPNMEFDIYSLSQSWDEGYGLSLEGEYTGACNWSQSIASVTWSQFGGSTKTYITGFTASDATFDFQIPVNSWIQSVVDGKETNYGFIFKVGNETLFPEEPTYKRLYSVQSNTIYSPRMDVYWDDRVRDDRNNLLNYVSDNKLYLYNRVRGEYSNINEINTSSNVLLVKLRNYPNATSASVVNVSASWLKKGQYLTDAINIGTSVTGSSGYIYDYWYSGSTLLTVGTCSIGSKSYSDYFEPETEFYVITTPNFNDIHYYGEIFDVEVFARDRYPNYTYSTSSISKLQTQTLYNASWSLFDYESDQQLIDYSKYTALSYNGEKNWFTFYSTNWLPINRALYFNIRYKQNGETLVEKLPVTFVIKE